MSSKAWDSAEFKDLIDKGVELQRQLSFLDMIAVGGTAAALHVGHRYSMDIDFVIPRFKEVFGDVKEMLDEWAEWKTNRYKTPMVILGEYQGKEFGLRQQRRSAPLEKTMKAGLVIPTVEESLRIKAYLLTDRHTMRDMIDVTALVDYLGIKRSLDALNNLNELYPQTTNQTTMTRVCEVLVARPHDFDEIELQKYKGLVAPYTDAGYLIGRCRSLAELLIKRELDAPDKGHIR